MKKTFEFEFPDEYGDKWIDHQKVLKLITTSEQLHEKASVKVRDISPECKVENPVAKRVYTLGGHDF
jgi:hypothetical protein